MISVKSYIKNSKECFIKFPTLSSGLLTHLEVSEYPDETLSLVFDITCKMTGVSIILYLVKGVSLVFDMTCKMTGVSTILYLVEGVSLVFDILHVR